MIPRIQVKADISFVNFIDVTLVLLIIFMITAPAMHNFLDVDLPSAKVSKANITEGIVITIRKDGTVFIDREKVKTEEFPDKFAEIWKKRSSEPVYVKADGEVTYNSVIDVIGIATQMGCDNIGLVVKEAPEKVRK